jgi:hypothetical protein
MAQEQVKQPVKGPTPPQTQNKGAVAPPPPSARPGTEDASGKKPKKEKKPKAERVEYPGLKDTEGKPVLLKGIPADYDRSKYKPLKLKNFEDPTEYFEQKAKHYEKLAADARTEAAEWKATGGVAPKQKAQTKKLVKMASMVEQLQKELAAEGIDVAALLAAAKAGKDMSTANAPA